MSKKQMLALLKQMLYAYFYMPKKNSIIKIQHLSLLLTLNQVENKLLYSITGIL